MTLTRPRLMALSLCALLALVVGLLAFAPGNPGRRMLAEHSPGMASMLPSAAPALVRSYDVAEEPPPQEPAVQGRAGAPVAVAVPRIAYTYGYAFRLDGGRLAAVQERHLALCRRLGPARCRVTSLRRGGPDDGGTSAELNLQVAAPLAEAFGRGLAAISAEAGAETVDRSIAAEDLSRQMIDSAARIRTRETLIRRLTGLLETRSGNIAQAVEAERAINIAQEELEAARAWLGEMEGRVAMSAVEISYLARGAVADAPNPVADALRQIGSISAESLAAMILIAGVGLPWLALGLLGCLLVRLVRRRFGQVIEVM